MIEDQIQFALGDLRRQSKMSLSLVLLGALFLVGSVYYSATRLRPLEEEVAKKRAELLRLSKEETDQRQKLEGWQKSFATLKESAEKLYGVRVTPGNQVYEVKATAQATGRALSQGRPEYRFFTFINSSPEALASIERVTYHFDHPTFEQKDYVSTDSEDRFRVTYVGWGCLSDVSVTVLLKGGTSHVFDFSMCKSLGQQRE